MKILKEAVRDPETDRVIVNAVGECICGDEVELGRFTCTCHTCGRDYNWAGQELAPRFQWGEETGETASDILNFDYENPEALGNIDY